MATEILRPHHCFPNYSNYYYNNHAATSRSSRNPSTRPEQRKRTQPLKRSSADYSRMDKVTILRRGESLDSKFKLDSSSVTSKSDVYAGSAFAVSPSPSALPLPSFPKKKQASPAFDDSATRDLRRLLRLE